MNAMLPKSKARFWLKCLLWLFLILLIPLSVYLYGYGPWIAWHLSTGALGGSVIVETDASCGDGEYRVVVYKYKNGNGYLELMNRAGKVFDSAEYTNGVGYGPLRWKPNCKKVMVTSNEGLMYLEVK
jgi:hypothetical protein